MAINQYLEQILAARYGKDVRQSIHDALQRTYDDVAVNNFATMGTLAENTDLKTVTETGAWNLSYTFTYINSPFPTGLLLVFIIDLVVYQVIFSGDTVNSVGDIVFRRRTGHGTEHSPYKWTKDYIISADYYDGSNSNRYDPKNEPGVRRGNRITLTEFELGNYRNKDGVLVNSTNYIRTKSLFKVKEFLGYWMDQDTETDSMYIVYFDKDLNYLDYHRLLTRNHYDSTSNEGAKVAPKGAVYAGVNYSLESVTNWPEKIELVEVDGSTLGEIRDPKVGENTDQIFFSKSRVAQLGDVSYVSDRYQCFYIPNPKCSKIAVSLLVDKGFQCVTMNENGEWSNGQLIEKYAPIGAIYSIPKDTVLIGVNLKKDASSYCTLIYDDDIKEQFSGTKYTKEITYPRLNGKSVAAIGDSITYIDGRDNDGEQTYLMGYQGYTRLCGASVRNHGYSGYTYSVNDQRSSIVSQIVDKIDMSDVDIAILAGGTNDVSVSVPIGTENSDYSSANVDDTTFIGAIGKLITYLRTENPKMEIFLCTLLPSEATTRSFSKIKTYNDAIKHCGEFWNVPIIDLFGLLNVHPGLNFSTFFYDSTHPNHVGTERMGKIIASYINNYMSIIG